MSIAYAGSARVEITPTEPAALSGFIARRNQPFTRVDDPLYARALALAADGEVYLLLNYELLGFNAAARDGLLAALEAQALPGFDRRRCVFTTTHTHSGPAVSPIEGEDGAGEAYLALLARQTVAAARAAIGALRPAALHVAEQAIEGLTYNRRAVLADGRVSIAYDPEMAVVERGPLDNSLTLLAWKDADGHTLGGLVNFACHGVALLTPAVSGDIPGQVMRQMETSLGAPCLFLQGAAGDVNPIAVAGERPGLLAWAAQFGEQVAGIAERLRPEVARSSGDGQAAAGTQAPAGEQAPEGEQAMAGGQMAVDDHAAGAGPGPAGDQTAQSTGVGPVLAAAQVVLPVAFRPLPPLAEVERNIAIFDQLGAGDFSALQAAETVDAVSNLLNIRPGDTPDPLQTAFTARALASAERRVLRAAQSGQAPAACPLEITGWRVGGVLLIFIGAEIFSVTGLRVRAMGKAARVLPVAYAAPVVGYIPDANSMRKGGYEANDAWRFYGQVGPFAEDTEERILAAVQGIVAALGG